MSKTLTLDAEVSSFGSLVNVQRDDLNGEARSDVLATGVLTQIFSPDPYVVQNVNVASPIDNGKGSYSYQVFALGQYRQTPVPVHVLGDDRIDFCSINFFYKGGIALLSNGSGHFIQESSENLGLPPSFDGFPDGVMPFNPTPATADQPEDTATLNKAGAVSVAAPDGEAGYLATTYAPPPGIAYSAIVSVASYAGHFSLALTDNANELLIVSGDLGVPCYASSARILTERGEIAVEALAVGHQVMALLSQGYEPITWIGNRTLRPSRHPRPDDVTPILIRAGVLRPAARNAIWSSAPVTRC